ncbi:MAG: cohesin domain-containing protein [Lachnospiraceae bacterium]
MKKLVTALLAVMMIASLASLAAFADGATAFHVMDTTVEEGATEVTVTVNVENTPAAGITGAKWFINYDEALTLKKAEKGTFTAEGQFGTSQNLTDKPYSFLWALGTDAVKVDGSLCTVTFTLPEGAKAGDTYSVSVTYSEDDTLDMNLESYKGFTMINGTISVVEKSVPSDTTTEAPKDDPTTEAPKDDPTTEAPKADDTTKKADDTTKKADDNKSAATGDMIAVVAAVMVVALGAAIVVKKVNVK